MNEDIFCPNCGVKKADWRDTPCTDKGGHVVDTIALLVEEEAFPADKFGG